MLFHVIHVCDLYVTPYSVNSACIRSLRRPTSASAIEPVAVAAIGQVLRWAQVDGLIDTLRFRAICFAAAPLNCIGFSEAMPPKSVPSAGRPSVGQSQSWQSTQSKRLEAQRKELSATKPPTVEAFAAAVYMTADQVVPTNVETLRELDATPLRSSDAAARLLHRRGDEGFLKTSFEPDRHTVIVAGRPVQVHALETEVRLYNLPSLGTLWNEPVAFSLN